MNMATTAGDQGAGKGTGDPAHIQVLKAAEAGRKRPGMYIGSTSERGRHPLVYDDIDNCVDEPPPALADRARVWIHHDNWSTVEDNGRGIPVEMHPTEE